MAFDLDALIENLKQVDLPGIVSVEKQTVGQEETQEVAIVRLLRLKGHLRKDTDSSMAMIVGLDSVEDPDPELRFLVLGLEDCEPQELALTIYMDANKETKYGGHKWESDKGGRVSFTYSMPLPEGVSGFPGVRLLRKVLQGIHRSLLFREFKNMELRIHHDDMLTDDERLAKAQMLTQVYNELTAFEPDDEDDDEAV